MRLCTLLTFYVYVRCLILRVCTLLTKVSLCTLLTKVSLCLLLTKVSLCSLLIKVSLCSLLTKVSLCTLLTKVHLCTLLTNVRLCTLFTWVRQCTLSWYWWWVERPPSDREEISEPRTQRPRLLLQTRPFPRRKKLNFKKKTFLLSFVSYSVISKFFDDIDIRFDNFCCDKYNLFFL